MNRSLPLAFAALVLGLALGADNICPCVPTTHLWVVKSCDTWDCAASAFVLSAGSADTIVVPTTSMDVRWVILQRIASGSAVSNDPTFKMESFNGWPEASSYFALVDSALKPMMLSAPDGKFLIVARNAPEPRRRAVGR